MKRKFLAGLVLPVIAVVLAGCSQPAPASPPAHNAADVTFAQGMVPHHRQAVEMAAPVPQHTANPRLIDLATQIQQAQQPEIDQLTAWLKTWGAPPPATGEMGGMDHGTSMSGMVDTAGLDQLRDQAYDRKWLELMIQHHEGAITMSRTELAQGQDPGAKAMAQHITDTQQTEITTMKSLLGS
ncbi:DUF305 domain-containing protein [Amycolatopsis saalfeldensis]|uniref:Uncharacterized conserved protein, DUF305 family n=1 Tax=Amycolatopsis saalfeldensis TaxID=394193 RepID=A0A1H8YEG8_9PSEU|nr:DUF305 domain-containing protein [Amycolatopsis saalfeldensis]SEP50413.1 Uncharacterized conserved protein, DUF305 family [Amycolatopsis saalfeldensis]